MEVITFHSVEVEVINFHSVEVEVITLVHMIAEDGNTESAEAWCSLYHTLLMCR